MVMVTRNQGWGLAGDRKQTAISFVIVVCFVDMCAHPISYMCRHCGSVTMVLTLLLMDCYSCFVICQNMSRNLHRNFFNHCSSTTQVSTCGNPHPLYGPSVPLLLNRRIHYSTALERKQCNMEVIFNSSFEWFQMYHVDPSSMPIIVIFQTYS